MKKLFFLAAAMLICFASCNKSAGPSASLKSEVDTLSYELGIANSDGLKMYLSERLGVDTAYMDYFYKGLVEAAQSGDNKKDAAYFAGIQIGQQIGTQMLKGINYQLFGEDSTKTISLRNILAGFIAGAQGKTLIPEATVKKELQERMENFRAKNLETTYGENKAAGEKFLAENAKKKGVKTLKSGLQYKVIKEGNGPIPADTSVVEAKYEGKTIDGKVFDSSDKNNDGKPVEIRVNQMIKGWTEALTLMPEGSEWELYIPQDLAYGSRETAAGQIKPFSALIFKLTLVKVKK